MSQISDRLLSLLPLPPGTMPWQVQGPSSRPNPQLFGANYKIVYVSWDDVISVAHGREGLKLRWRGPCDINQMPRTQILAWTLVPEETPPSGKELLGTDFASIETRAIAYLVDKAQENALEKLAEKIWEDFKSNYGVLRGSPSFPIKREHPSPTGRTPPAPLEFGTHRKFFSVGPYYPPKNKKARKCQKK